MPSDLRFGHAAVGRPPSVTRRSCPRCWADIDAARSPVNQRRHHIAVQIARPANLSQSRAVVVEENLNLIEGRPVAVFDGIPQGEKSLVYSHAQRSQDFDTLGNRRGDTSFCSSIRA